MPNLPVRAAWRHVGARTGFEVVFIDRTEPGYLVEGHSTAVEDGKPWAVRYLLRLGPTWTTEHADVAGRSRKGSHALTLEHDGEGRWRLDGQPAPALEGCLDVDLEASVLTNALPVRRLGLGVGKRAEAPAAWVRALDLSVEPLQQGYALAEDDGALRRYDYSAPALDYSAQLEYDEHGLLIDYPGLAVRVA
ncbi:MAG: putative glycolipid-binding domain-containing protein [Thermoleophilaceae bacterium]|nr:putative glycolipid-binding domain-containing protein [Thermoleophilaceae bacterium]